MSPPNSVPLRPRRWPAVLSRRSLSLSACAHALGLAVLAATSVRLLAAASGSASESLATLTFAQPRDTEAEPFERFEESLPKIEVPDTSKALEELELVESDPQLVESPAERRLPLAPTDPEPLREALWTNPQARPGDEPEPVPQAEPTSAAPAALPEPAITEKPSPTLEPAVVLYAPRPPYPRLARRMAWEGRVTCRIGLTSAGAVATVVVVKSSGYSTLDDAAIEALRKWRFRPASRDGRAVASDVMHRITFQLTD